MAQTTRYNFSETFGFGIQYLVAVAFFALSGTLSDLVQGTLRGVGSSQLRFFSNPIPPLFGPHPADDPRFIFLYTPPTIFNAIFDRISTENCWR